MEKHPDATPNPEGLGQETSDGPSLEPCANAVEASQVNVRLTPEVLHELHAVKDRIGIPVSEQLRRAIRLWLNSPVVQQRLTLERPRRGERRARGPR